MQGVTEMDEVEKAVRLGADAESMVARELKEPRCVAGGRKGAGARVKEQGWPRAAWIPSPHLRGG